MPESVFVWTPRDIVALIFLATALLVVAGYLLGIGIRWVLGKMRGKTNA